MELRIAKMGCGRQEATWARGGGLGHGARCGLPGVSRGNRLADRRCGMGSRAGASTADPAAGRQGENWPGGTGGEGWLRLAAAAAGCREATPGRGRLSGATKATGRSRVGTAMVRGTVPSRRARNAATSLRNPRLSRRGKSAIARAMKKPPWLFTRDVQPRRAAEISPSEEKTSRSLGHR